MSQRVTIVGPNLPGSLQRQGTFHVHAEGCADLKRGAIREEAENGWTIEASSVDEVVQNIYDPGNFQYDPSDPADYSPYLHDVHFAPCVQLHYNRDES